MKLYKFSLPEYRDCLFLLSETGNENEMRRSFRGQDNGGLDFQTFRELYSRGTIQEVTELGQVSERDFEYVPYLDDNISYTAYNFLTVKRFLEGRPTFK